MNEEMVLFRTCLASEIASKEIIKGSIIMCSDSGDCYFDSLDGERVQISKQIVWLETESNRTSMLTPESDKVYIVKETQLIYIYNNGWICLNSSGDEDMTIYFSIYNVEVNAAASSSSPSTTVVEDARVNSNSSAQFYCDPSLIDLATAQGVSISCSCNDGSITISSNCTYKLFGTIEVTGTNSEFQNVENVPF